MPWYPAGGRCSTWVFLRDNMSIFTVATFYRHTRTYEFSGGTHPVDVRAGYQGDVGRRFLVKVNSSILCTVSFWKKTTHISPNNARTDLKSTSTQPKKSRYAKISFVWSVYTPGAYPGWVAMPWYLVGGRWNPACPCSVFCTRFWYFLTFYRQIISEDVTRKNPTSNWRYHPIVCGNQML